MDNKERKRLEDIFDRYLKTHPSDRHTYVSDEKIMLWMADELKQTREKLDQSRERLSMAKHPAKFEIGQRVRILDGSSIKDYTGSWASPMSKLIGRTGKITHRYHFPNDRYAYRIDIEEAYIGVIWDERGLESASESKVITITTDGKVTRATYVEGSKVVKSRASCNDGDTFDFSIGVNLAVSRLLDRLSEPKKPNFGLNAKMAILSGAEDAWYGFENNKVYEINDGKIIVPQKNSPDKEFPVTGRIQNEDDLKFYFTAHGKCPKPSNEIGKWGKDVEFVLIDETYGKEGK